MSKPKTRRLDRFDEELTERVAAAIENGTAPWSRPWSVSECQDFTPRNVKTGRAYSGGNVLWLLLAEWPDQRWLGFGQAKDLGGRVRKGEKGTPILVMSGPPKRDPDDDEEEKKVRRPWIGVRTVFNIAQCDDLELDDAPVLIPPAPDAGAVVVRIAATMGVRIIAGGDRAAYSLDRDVVFMPAEETFESRAAYEHVLMHELAHATMHRSRLDRNAGDHALEELHVEMAAMLAGCALGIGHDPVYSERYCANWAEGLRSADKAGAARAAGTEASRIADYLLECAQGAEEAA